MNNQNNNKEDYAKARAIGIGVGCGIGILLILGQAIKPLGTVLFFLTLGFIAFIFMLSIATW